MILKKYYLHNNTESTGPFDLEEIKTKNITKTTPVWFQGMENWKPAGEIEELRSIFAVVPPAFKSFSTLPPNPNVDKKVKNQKILGLSKTTFFIVLVIVILLIGTFIFNTIQENRSVELDLKNHQTEVYNQQIELQEKEIEAEKIRSAEQEKIETERIQNERKQAILNRLSEIKNLLAVDSENLEDAKKRLTDATDFQLLRTNSDRNEEISQIQNEIDHWQSEIVKLKLESDQLKLELEKIH